MALDEMSAEPVADRQRALEVDSRAAAERAERRARKSLVRDLRGDGLAVRDRCQADAVDRHAFSALERLFGAGANAQPRARIELLDRFDDATAVNDSGEHHGYAVIMRSPPT